MSDPQADEIWKDFLLGLLRGVEVAEGTDVCDRCGGTIWPAMELVRCGSCVGEHGAPSEEKIKEACERHKDRIGRARREERDAEYA